MIHCPKRMAQISGLPLRPEVRLLGRALQATIPGRPLPFECGSHNTAKRKQKQMAKKQNTVVVPEIERETLITTIVGDTPLIVHAWSEKAIRMMRLTQGIDDKPRTRTKEPKVPEEEYEASKYRLEDGTDGFPAAAFKAAAVRAGKMLGLKMTDVRQMFRVVGQRGRPGRYGSPMDLVPLTFQEVHMREDLVRLNGKTADLRYRAEYIGWRAELEITYVRTTITPAEIINLLNHAGMTVGVGEWRMEKHGDAGSFHVATAEDMKAAA